MFDGAELEWFNQKTPWIMKLDALFDCFDGENGHDNVLPCMPAAINYYQQVGCIGSLLSKLVEADKGAFRRIGMTGGSP